MDKKEKAAVKTLANDLEHNVDLELVQLVVDKYLERCIFIHCMAFMQFRKNCPDLKNYNELKAVFDDRKNVLVKEL
jgi:hypothetical protein